MSDAIYYGAHSLTIGDKHTWRDWHLIPVERPEFADAEPKFTYIEVPGSDGELDASEALAGRLLFNMREGQFQFYVDNDHEPWVQLYGRIKRYLQGRQLKAVLDDDPLWYYEGRFWCTDASQDGIHMKITINYKVKAYKYKLYTSIEDVPWDPLTLDDVVPLYLTKDIHLEGETIVELPARAIGRAAVIPRFIVEIGADNPDGSIDLELTNPELKISRARSLAAGSTTDPGFILSGQNDDNVCRLKFSGNGKVSIEYRSGEL
jgi:hypothetical protein